ncbi:putative amyloid beta protein, partial [Operophtera brumata]
MTLRPFLMSIGTMQNVIEDNMLQEKRLCILGSELSDLDTFERLLRYGGCHLALLQCFQMLQEKRLFILGSELSDLDTFERLLRYGGCHLALLQCFQMLQEKRLCILGSELSDLDTFERLLRYGGCHLALLQCFQILQEKRLCILGSELSDLDTFERLLRYGGCHLALLQCFQAVVEHGSKLSTELASSYLTKCGFLNEAGWYADAARVLLRCRDICQAQPQSTYYKRLTLECCHRCRHICQAQPQSTYYKRLTLECCHRWYNEVGWYADAARVLLRCRDICQAQPRSTYYKRLTLECCHRWYNEAGWYADAARVLLRSRDICQAQPQSTYYKRLTLEFCHRWYNEAGWYADAARVLLRSRDICQAQPQSTYYKRLTLEFCHRWYNEAGWYADATHVMLRYRHICQAQAQTTLLNTQSAYCCFPAAAETYSIALELMGISEDAEVTNELPGGAFATAETCSSMEWHGAGRSRCGGAWGASALAARTCKEFSALFFVRCDYNLAHQWAMRALRLLDHHTPPKIMIDVLRACAKACVVKRRFECAGAAAAAAVSAARAVYGHAHPRYAAALLDYGFYLLNIDSIVHSVAVYKEALNILEGVFGRRSLHVATAQEDLAYALYVLEYSSGRFYMARDHAERAIQIIEKLVPPDHLLLASAKRVKALILEEIALDIPAGQDMSEKNVQTAKHYGNLGRLYQSMQKFSDAETMHLKAIAIKEELLGPEDYEVGLSIGHLASLYNYHMNMHHAAEKLYLRSISISLKLFGERYSGLEYDYRGLVH